MPDDRLLTKSELAEIRRQHADVPVVERLVNELERAREAVNDVAAILETLQLAWRDREPGEHAPEEIRGKVETLARRLRAFQEGDEEAEREAADEAIGDLQQDFERGGGGR